MERVWVRLALGTVCVALIAAGLGLRVTGEEAHGAATSVTVNVDFGKAVAPIDPTDIGATVSGYGTENVSSSDEQQGLLRSLGLKLLRIELKFATAGDPSGGVTCNSLGCVTSVRGEKWLAGIKAVGAEPMLVVNIDPEHPIETDAKDAVSLAKFAADQGVPIKWFIVGNEPDLGGNQKKMGVNEYVKRFNAVADALHAAYPDAKVGGPALAGASDGYVEPFLQGSGAKLDFFDLHHYGDCAGQNPSDADVLADVSFYKNEIDRVRKKVADLLPDRAGKIPIQYGEFNMQCDRSKPRSYEHVATVWGAAALGTILASDARAVQFSDLNQGLGLVAEEDKGGIQQGEPLPIYHGIGMFTGEGKFRRFGSTLVDATSSNGAVRVFASTEAKNVVVVNTSTDAAELNLSAKGLAADETNADLWQTTKEEPAPHLVGSLAIEGGKGSVAVPGRSVTTLVIAPGAQPPGTTTTTGASTTTTTVAPTTTTSPPTTQPPADGGSGLKAEYFDNADLTGKTHVRTEPRVYLDYEHAPFEDFGPDEWSVRWTGRVRVDTEGAYTFTTTTDDGARLWVDGKLVIDDWAGHPIKDTAGKLTLTKGWHELRLEYVEQAGIAFAKLSWQGPNRVREVVPTEHLSPAGGV